MPPALPVDDERNQLSPISTEWKEILINENQNRFVGGGVIGLLFGTMDRRFKCFGRRWE
jgi:hypothetical protein